MRRKWQIFDLKLKCLYNLQQAAGPDNSLRLLDTVPLYQKQISWFTLNYWCRLIPYPFSSRAPKYARHETFLKARKILRILTDTHIMRGLVLDFSSIIHLVFQLFACCFFYKCKLIYNVSRFLGRSQPLLLLLLF